MDETKRTTLELWETELLAAADKYGIASYMREGFIKWAVYGRPAGGFIMACMENNLMQAMVRADETNRQNLFDIVGWIYNQAPSPCHGSPEKVKRWQAIGGLRDLPIEEVADA